ncbi:uroporphyrinogen-III C-methyltransferase [Hydrocarboniclastica marina]|uniref:uroporphyrinogen-III C-methyltransferase n=1 Tax=Hydrocarboniclastica marina TaxID=2259620 RepID=UPI001FE9A35C|nr:uroporphyrinogen-III C-methyltransferase [Hydrocarboniclastica marina]
MSDEKTTQPESTTPPTPPPRPGPATRPQKAPRQRTLWLAIVVLLLGLIAMALATGWLWQQRQSLEQQVSEIGQSVEEIRGQRQNAGSELSGRIEQLQASQREQAEQQRKLERQIDQAARSLLQMGNRTRNDWLLAEAEYLLRIGNQRLRMERDIDGALALLENADAVLAETEDMSTYPVRQELAREIQALRAVEDVDRVGLYLQLEAAIEQVEQLNTASLANTSALPQTQDGKDESATASADNTSDYLARAWEATKQTLSEVVVIRRMDEPVDAPLSPEQSAYANLNLRLMLEEAEMALLRANPVLYRRTLEKAQKWLEQWYDESSNQVAALAQTLSNLAKRDIRPDLPDISDSLNLLKARIAGRLQDNQQAGDNANSKSDTATGGSDQSNGDRAGQPQGLREGQSTDQGTDTNQGTDQNERPADGGQASGSGS